MLVVVTMDTVDAASAASTFPLAELAIYARPATGMSQSFGRTCPIMWT
jgi:hypothetical protein